MERPLLMLGSRMLPLVSDAASNTSRIQRATIMNRIMKTLLGLCFALLLVGCKTHYIPNTDVEDTEYNQRVVDFCEEYRKAVERQNIALLLKLADKRYYEDGGNTDSQDDIDYAGLEEYLKSKFRETRNIRYEIRYRQIGRGRKNVIYVDFTYSASYRIPTHQGEVWRRKVADNRLELVPHGESFRIISGM